jgi:NAD(P)-dependent dehydrogenase (short-subunit alcohol dehydrogenase family)
MRSWVLLEPTEYPLAVAERNGQRVAIVTGASSGIGLTATQALLERGYSVIANSRTITRSAKFKTFHEPHPGGRRHQHESGGGKSGCRRRRTFRPD